ncbi:MAG: Gfo/Idh/MocA family protein [Aggregatilineales bacterium]
MTHPLRIGVIGCGAIAQIMHLPHLTDYTEYFDLVAIADANQAVLDAVGDHFHIARRFVDWRELLASADIDAVVLSHSGSHHDAVIAALDANKHVFCEKPLGWNVREVEAVAARAAKSDRVVQIGYHKLYDPGFAYAKAHIPQMRDIALARITMLHPDNNLGLSPHRIRRGNGVINEGHADPAPWPAFVKAQLDGAAGGPVASLVDEALGARKSDARLRLGYGFLVQSIIHQVYTIFGLLGQPSRVVSTDIWREGMSIHTVIEYPNDCVCTLDFHYLPYLKDYREEYAFFGNHERLILQFPSPYYRNFPSPVIVQGGEHEQSWEKHITVSYDEAFRNELLAFAENVRLNRKPISSVDDAVQHTRFIQQMIDAAR